MGISAQLDAAGVGIVHHFAGGVYAKETHIPAGVKLTQHIHSFDHLSSLASGSVLLRAGGFVESLKGPAAIEIKAGVEHEVEALTDAIWFCIWPSDETDPDKIDAELIK